MIGPTPACADLHRVGQTVQRSHAWVIELLHSMKKTTTIKSLLPSQVTTGAPHRSIVLAKSALVNSMMTHTQHLLTRPENYLARLLCFQWWCFLVELRRPATGHRD